MVYLFRSRPVPSRCPRCLRWIVKDPIRSPAFRADVPSPSAGADALGQPLPPRVCDPRRDVGIAPYAEDSASAVGAHQAPDVLHRHPILRRSASTASPFPGRVSPPSGSSKCVYITPLIFLYVNNRFLLCLHNLSFYLCFLYPCSAT